ncbi:glycoside hydrolase 5 family protein [Halosegnis marinus]|uniref:mannan endo-1,4-beta-mannosidase n=1 Tax=Halosegnis marinus TaxID=3034023 RepID=A0ABD5ZMM0_9EURY|nr:cellulase family glycosylhydrolase [Halosegnis sp. DT85]
MDRSFSRRDLLRAVPSAGALALAGCNAPSESDGETGTEGGTEVRVTTTATGSATATGTPTATRTATRTATATATDTATAVPDPRVAVTDLTVEPTTVRQGGEVRLTVTLANRGGPGDPHPLALRGDDGVLRRTRLATDADSMTATFTVRCDRPGTRTFRAGDREAAVAVEPWPAGFVGTDGTAFVADGEPFTMVGTNNAYLHHKSHKTVDEVFRDAADMGLNVVRALINGGGTEVGNCRDFACDEGNYGLQPGPREYDEASFRQFDYMVATAKRYGVRVLPTLITPSPGGMSAYVEWVDGATELGDFYTHPECRAIYRDYLEQVLTRENTYTGVEYRNDPTIALWELANEPETEGAPFGDALQEWVAEMAAHAKSLDPNHLVSVGLIGWNDAGNESDYLACFESDAVDAASTHMYYDADGIDDWVERHATGVHDRLGKPLYVGEFGWDATRTEDDYRRQLSNRNEGFREWYEQFERYDVAGSLFWFLLGHVDEGARFPDHDGFGVYYPEDATTTDIVSSAADRLAGGDR